MLIKQPLPTTAKSDFNNDKNSTVPFTSVCQRIAVTVLAVLLLTSCSPAINNTAEFRKLPIDISGFGLFDLGVADINNDSIIDIYTVNHSASQNVLLNQGNGTFVESFSKLSLDQDSDFPGLAVATSKPSLTKPGLYVYWVGPSVVLRTHELDDSSEITGKISLWSDIKTVDTNNSKVTIEKTNTTPPVTHSTLDFSIQGDGSFSFKPAPHAMPIRFAIKSGFSANQVYVGPNFVSPKGLEFKIQMRDRHGMAWNDFDNNGEVDVFITRGGQKGLMRRMPDPFWDELFVKQNAAFKDIGEVTGLKKNGCSGRQTSWVDFNSDGLLDLYVVCGRGSDFQPNQLFMQVAGNTFRDVAAEVGLDIGADGSFAWLDVDADVDMDLLWADSSGFFLFRNQSGNFTRSFLGHSPRQFKSGKLSVIDFDSDGDLDVFVAAKSGNALCLNTGGTFVISDPSAWGLPKKSVTANWVDYDNNGTQDLHTVPDGLFKQLTYGSFKRQQLLDVAASKFSPIKVNSAIANWFDTDGNGTRDIILALKLEQKGSRWAKWLSVITGNRKEVVGPLATWQVSIMENRLSSNHWINLELVGPPGNRPAIGAKVSVETGDVIQTQQIGSAEGARFSQGHYRLYFGLGSHPQPKSIRIVWPDGKTQVISQPVADRLLKVEWESTS